jgi:hypothetical protein
MEENAGRISSYFRPLYRQRELQQRYFVEGIKASLHGSGNTLLEVPMSGHPLVLSALGKVLESAKVRRVIGRERAGRLVKRAGGVLEGPARGPSPFYHSEVGQYLFESGDGKTRRVCIDAADYPDVASPELLAWSDLYLKTNCWGGRRYPDRVRPMYGPNPYVLGRLDRLKGLRGRDKRYDLCFVVRIWGGSNEMEGVEHNLRLLEEISRVGGRNFLYAWIVAGDVESQARRLDRRGIPWSDRPLPLEELWDVSARSSACVIRLGMHFCIPWRMTDLLALGACPILDSSPFTRWPRPLVAGENYLCLDLKWSPRKMVAGEEEYRALPAAIET